MTEARLNAANDLNTGLRELRKLAEKATPGPWFVAGPPWNEHGAPYVIAGAEDPHAATFVCDLDAPDENHLVEERERVEATAAFIAACSPSVLVALTEVAAKAAEYRRLEEAEPAKVDDPARMEWEPQVDEAAVALDDSLARLSVCFSGAQPSHEGGHIY